MLSDGQRKGVAYERLMTDARHRADHLSSATVAASRPYLSTVQCCRGRGDSGLAVARFSRWSGAEWPMWVIFSRRAPSPLTAAYPQIASVLGGGC